MTVDSPPAAQAGTEPLIRATGLSKVYGTTRVLNEVDLTINRGEVVGLIGANGAGKSTLIKCLSGVIKLSDGSIRVDGHALTATGPEEALSHGIAAVPQEVTLVPAHSVAENILLGRFPSIGGFVTRRRLNRRAREVLVRMGLGHLDPASSVEDLTPTEKKMVMVAAVLARDPQLLILDEPTAGLPSEESTVLLDLVAELSAAGVAVLYVSHRLHEVQTLCSRVVALKNGSLSGVLSADSITRDRMLALIGGEEKAPAASDRKQRAERTGDALITARGVCGSRVRDVDLLARPGEIIGIAGLAGSGRSELLRLLYGLQSLSAGSVDYRGTTYVPALRTRLRPKMGYVAELRQSNVLHGLDVSKNLTCNSVGAHRKLGVFADRKWELQVTETVRSQVSLVGAAKAPIETLSGGNQQKVLISRWLVQGVDLLLLDEPTAGVDLVARAEIHELLRSLADSGLTVIFASVETDELAVLADRVLVMVEGEVRAELQAPFTEQTLVSALFSHRESPAQASDAHPEQAAAG
jgi:ABC-type sugar transport system ATPase subunit